MKALFLNCTLKPSPQKSNTEALMQVAIDIMESQGVTTELLRPVDFDIAPGVQDDMSGNDEWPTLLNKVLESDILVIGTPIWLGDKSSVCTRVIERLYAHSGELNDKGQYDFYGRVGGCIITGNEDGAKHCAMNILYSLQHLGLAIPPQADAGWVGEAGPGPSYADEGSGGPENRFTQRNTTFMAHNLIHLAKLLNKTFPLGGNQVTDWNSRHRM